MTTKPRKSKFSIEIVFYSEYMEFKISVRGSRHKKKYVPWHQLSFYRLLPLWIHIFHFHFSMFPINDSKWLINTDIRVKELFGDQCLRNYPFQTGYLVLPPPSKTGYQKQSFIKKLSGVFLPSLKKCLGSSSYRRILDKREIYRNLVCCIRRLKSREFTDNSRKIKNPYWCIEIML